MHTDGTIRWPGSISKTMAGSREIQEGDMELLREARPDFMGVNYYATATVSAPKNDGHDRQPRNGDQQVMVGEEGVYRAEENECLPSTEYWLEN